MPKRNWGTPKYHHDTQSCCRFLGSTNAVVDGDEPYELWVCYRKLSAVDNTGRVVVMAQITGESLTRYVEEFNRYVDLDPKTDPFLSVAYERAMEKDSG